MEVVPGESRSKPSTSTHANFLGERIESTLEESSFEWTSTFEYQTCRNDTTFDQSFAAAANARMDSRG